MYCWVDGESPLLWGETDSVKFLPCSSYLMSIIKFSKCAIQLINSQIGHFFWDNTEEKHKYHLANWQMISQEKECGGMGVPDLRDLNLCIPSPPARKFTGIRPPFSSSALFSPPRDFCGEETKVQGLMCKMYMNFKTTICKMHIKS